MLACMVMLGLQLCFPLQLQASVMAAQQIDLISLGAKDPEDKPGVDLKLDLPPAVVLILSAPTATATPSCAVPGTEDAAITTLLVVAGFHPSAP